MGAQIKQILFYQKKRRLSRKFSDKQLRPSEYLNIAHTSALLRASVATNNPTILFQCKAQRHKECKCGIEIAFLVVIEYNRKFYYRFGDSDSNYLRSLKAHE